MPPGDVRFETKLPLQGKEVPQRIFDLWDKQVGSDQEVPGETGCKPSRIDRLTTGWDKGVARKEWQKIIGLNAMFRGQTVPWLAL